MFHLMSSLVRWDVVIIALIILKTHIWYVTFNVEYYILSQIFHKKSDYCMVLILELDYIKPIMAWLFLSKNELRDKGWGVKVIQSNS